MAPASTSPDGGLSSASPPGAPPESSSALGPFQASRPSRASTISAELTAPPTTANEASVPPGAGPPPSATAAVPAPAGDPYTALASQREGAWLTYQPRLGSYAACGSHRCPGSPSTPTQLFGSAMERSVPLRLHRLQYDWQQYARSGVTVAELLSRPCLRPDLVRIQRIHEAGLVDEASFALRRLLKEGGGVAYQIPDGISSDRTFAYSIEEAEYVDRMAFHLFREGPWDLNRFVLPEDKGLYVCPCPYPYSKPLVALQKSACSLMRLYSVAVAHFDWSAYPAAGEEDGCVFLSAAFERGLSVHDFPELPPSVRDSFPSVGVHPLLPPVQKHFGFACADSAHPAHPRLAYNYEREWDWSLCSAYMTEVSINERVFIQLCQTIAWIERLTPGLPTAFFHPLEHHSPHLLWAFEAVVDLMVRASEVSDLHHHSWMDITTGTRSAFLAYDARGDAFLSRLVTSPSGRLPTGKRGGVGSEARKGRRKRYRHLDAVAPVSVFPPSSQTRAPPSSGNHEREGASEPSPMSASLPIPPLGASVSRPVPGSAVRALTLSMEDLREVPDLTQVLGGSWDRA